MQCAPRIFSPLNRANSHSIDFPVRVGANEPVNFTIRSRTETQSKNTTNHHIIASVPLCCFSTVEFHPFI
jgi:hypothetical protein